MNNTQKWLAQQEQLRIELAAQNKPPFFNNFDDYVKIHPTGERFRAMVRNGILVATYQNQSCLPGDYYIAYAFNWKNKYGVVVNNGDDGYVRKFCDSYEIAQQELENLKLLAPFYYGTLVESFNFFWD